VQSIKLLFREIVWVCCVSELGLKYLQLEEALGRPHELMELGDRFIYRYQVLYGDKEKALVIYQKTIEQAK
jgi:hypothetical protein